jgi:hypothetical protein
MPRIRTLKPEFWTSESVAQLPIRARLTFAGILTAYLDDHGRGRDNPMLVKAAIYPLDDELAASSIQEDLDAIEATGGITRYESDGKQYFYAPGWADHQYINKPSPSKCPDPPPSGRTPKSPEIPEDSPEDPDFPEEIRVGSGSGSKKTRSKTRPQLTLLSDSKPDPMERFEEFWAAYPRRVAKRAAEKAWLAAIRRRVEPKTMIAGAERYTRESAGREAKYVKHPATWLNAGSYDDEPESRVSNGGRQAWRGTYGT